MKALLTALGTLCGLLSGVAIGAAFGTVVGFLTVVGIVLRAFAGPSRAREALHHLVQMEAVFDTYFSAPDNAIRAHANTRTHAA
jgi:hypothetical protein